MKTFVWDASAIINIKEPDKAGYSPGHSLMKDLSDGWIAGLYRNIFPSIAVFEVAASVSRKHREGRKILREFYIMDEHSSIYPIDEAFIRKTHQLVSMDGFSELRGADLIYACIAYKEKAFLVTMDGHFQKVSHHIRVINLNDSRESAQYRDMFEE